MKTATLWNWCEVKTWCLCFSIEDGVHGIVIWDMILVVTIAFNGISTMIYYLGAEGNVINAIADFATTGFLFVRSIYACYTLGHHLKLKMLKRYLILRIVWDIILFIGYIVLIIFDSISIYSFFFNIILVVSIDGYFNFIIYALYKIKFQCEEDPLWAGQDNEQNEENKENEENDLENRNSENQNNQNNEPSNQVLRMRSGSNKDDIVNGHHVDIELGEIPDERNRIEALDNIPSWRQSQSVSQSKEA